jgi:hypothetical protein
LEVAAMGSRAKLRTKEGGNLGEHLDGMQRSGMEARLIQIRALPKTLVPSLKA